MKTIIKKIAKNVLDIFDRIKWQKQYKTIVSGVRKTNYKLNSGWVKGCKILLMVPHADDELISSYTVLCNADDITVYYCGFTGSNNSEENSIRRHEELLKLCSVLNVRVIEGKRKCDNLKTVLDEGKYDVILLPSIVDWHNEHRTISYLINRNCIQLNIAPKILTYSVTVPNESDKAVYCVSLSKEQQIKKYDLFNDIYVSQRFMPVARLKLNERINGFYSGCFAAEVFLMYSFDEWSSMVFEVELLEGASSSKLFDFYRSLSSNLNNLILIRQCSKELYRWIETKVEVV